MARTAQQASTPTTEASVPDAGRQYVKDPYTWAKTQAEAMRKREYEKMDWDNLVEEVADLALYRRNQWTSNCARGIEHMHKILRWPGSQGYLEENIEKWRFEIVGGKKPFRKRMKAAIDDNPGLKGDLDEMLDEAWQRGCQWAAEDFAVEESGGDDAKVAKLTRKIRKTFPEKCPWTLVELAGYNPRDRRGAVATDPVVWPAEVAQRLNRTLKTSYPECGWDVEYEKGPARTCDEIERRKRGGRAARGKRKGRGAGRARQSLGSSGRQA